MTTDAVRYDINANCVFCNKIVAGKQRGRLPDLAAVLLVPPFLERKRKEELILPLRAAENIQVQRSPWTAAWGKKSRTESRMRA